MKLLDIYASILKFVGLEADQHGYINTVINNSKEPATINGLQMIMPTTDHLRNFKPTEEIIFHPLTENSLRGESEVLQKIKLTLNVKLNYTIGIIAQNLLNIIASPEVHSSLTPEQFELLLSVKDADEKSVTNFTSCMVTGAKTRSDRLFINIYLKRGGSHRNKRYARVGVTSFPFYYELLNDKVDKIRVKDKETFKQLFQFMFPGIDDEEEYNYGSSCQVAPYLDSLLKTATITAARLNDLVSLYKEHIDDADELVFESNWLEYFDDLNALSQQIRDIPVQFGNDGSVNIIEEQQRQQPVQQVVQQPMVQQQMPQQQFVQQPVMMAPARPEVKHTGRGLDFKSMMQNNYQLACIPNALSRQLAGNQVLNQQQVMLTQEPSWAQPQPQMMPMMQPMMQPQMVPQPNGQVMMTPNGPMFVPAGMVQQPQMMPMQQPMMQGNFSYPR